MNRSSRIVLIVDSNASMRYYHCLMLMRLHYVVLTAPSHEEAFLSMKCTVPSIILVSNSPSEESGKDFLNKMRSSDRLGAVPVIALIDAEDAGTRSDCLKKGYAACLAKPADPHLLYRAIQTITEDVPREHIRINMSLKALVGPDSAARGEEKVHYTSMISEGGMYLQTYSPAPKRTLTPVSLFLMEREIRIKAEVLYSSRLDHRTFLQPGMGMKFLEIMNDDRIFLRSFIREQLVRDIIPEYLRVA